MYSKSTFNVEEAGFFEILNMFSLTRQHGAIQWKSVSKIFTAF